ncbi:hypothetical protein [Lichenibacterium dinghuense]|uniref:hypothetical protein n=1 Tax=Lichenibacterium dinghuense TaxID=2895977 RepID=UPI001F420CD5|nr:hypothetical protein [Lichenibacterium sp. 6Y81]
MNQADDTTARWDPERRELVVTAGGRVLHVTDKALDTWQFDLDHLPAEFTETFCGPEFERVREGLRPGYEAAQAARAELRWSAIGSSIHDLTGLSTNDGDEGVFETDLARRGYRIVRI